MSYALLVLVFASGGAGHYYLKQSDTSTGWSKESCAVAARIIQAEAARDKFKSTVVVARCVPTRSM